MVDKILDTKIMMKYGGWIIPLVTILALIGVMAGTYSLMVYVVGDAPIFQEYCK